MSQSRASFFGLEGLMYVCVVSLCIIHPDWIGAWLDAPEWMGGIIIIQLATQAFFLTIYRRCLKIDDKLDKLIKGDDME